MSFSESAYEWMAVAGVAIGVLCLILLVVIAFSLRRIRRAQKIVMAGNDRDVVAHAEALQREFVSLRDWLEDVSVVLDKRMERLERGLEGSITHTAMVRYDAFGAKSGKQSSSVALLNEHRTGVVLTAIVSRNFSHLYVKNLVEGTSDIDLSPEERHAVELAFAAPGEPPAPPAPPAPTRVVSGEKVAGPEKIVAPPEPPGTPEVRQAREAGVEH